MTKVAYSLTEAAAASGLSRSYLDRAIRQGDLKAKRSAKAGEDGRSRGSYVIPAAALAAFVDALEDA